MATPLLLHACCGPCSLEPLRLLREEGFEPTICWTNPNIQPVAEHDLRLRTLQAWAADVAHVEVVVAADDRDAWERGVAPAGFDRRRRCRACYALRLAEACRVACERGFSHVSTTLAVSPYQLFDDCSELLVSLAEKNGLTPVVRDFRPYYPQATTRSRELGMYRQNYCGCRFSAAEATIERHEARDARKAQKSRPQPDNPRCQAGQAPDSPRLPRPLPDPPARTQPHPLPHPPGRTQPHPLPHQPARTQPHPLPKGTVPNGAPAGAPLGTVPFGSGEHAT